MARRSSAHRHPDAPSLPPIEFRKPGFHDLESPNFEPIETPLTPVGLVDKRRLFKVVNTTLSSTYKWPSVKDDEHHLLWPNAWYADLSTQVLDPSSPVIIDPATFRNQRYNKVDLPRTFHQWIHLVTLPPAMPSEETMWFVSLAQDSVYNMAESVRLGKQLYRKKSMPNATYAIRVAELYENFHDNLSIIRQMPREFQILDPEHYKDVRNVTDMLSLRGELGRLATKPTLATATRHIRQNINDAA